MYFRSLLLQMQWLLTLFCPLLALVASVAKTVNEKCNEVSVRVFISKSFASASMEILSFYHYQQIFMFLLQTFSVAS